MIKTNTKSYDKHPLSQCWQSYSQRPQSGSSRLSFFGKGITYIDRLDILAPQSVLLAVREIDLSHNAIVKLDNIRQFANVEVVNLAHNHIIDGRSLGKLKKLVNLKTVMVKGNPFLKSGEGKIEAYKLLLHYETDIQLLTPKHEQNLVSLIEKFAWLSTRKQYLSHIETQIQLITDYNIKIPQECSGPVFNRVTNHILSQHYEYAREECRREVMGNVLRGREQEMERLSEKETLLGLLMEFMDQYGDGLDRELADFEKIIEDKEEVLAHVKVMRKEKLAKDNYSTLFKRPSSKPLLSIPSSQNIPKQRQPSYKQGQSQFIISYTSIQQQVKRPVETKVQTTFSKKLIEERFEAYYNNMLTKYNPVYQLLYSPLQSLKSKEKDLLIETLSAHLKEKSFAAYKAEKLKEEHHQLTRRHLQRQSSMKLAEQRFLQYKMSTNEQISALESELSKKQANLQSVSQKLGNALSQKNQLAKKISFLQEQVSEYKLQSIQNGNKVQKHQNKQQIYEKIKQVREQNIKKQYLKLICLKAHLLYQLKKTQKSNKQREDKQMTQFCFGFIQSEARNSQLTKNLTKKMNENHMKVTMFNFLINTRRELSFKKLLKSIILKGKQQFLRTLTLRHTYKKSLEQRLLKFTKLRQQRTNSMYFKEWKEQMQQKRYIDNLEKAKNLYQANLFSRAYKNWLVYVKLPIHLQAQLSVDLKTYKMCKFLSQLRKNYEASVLGQGKFLNLIVFLNKNRRLNNFSRFKQFALQASELREFKATKMATILKINYFYEFVRSAKISKTHKKDKQVKQAQLLNLRKKQIFDKFNSEGYTRQLRLKRLHRIFSTYRKTNIAQSLRESLKQFMIQDKSKKNSIKHFLTMMQLSHNRKLKMDSKQLELKYIKISQQFRNKKGFLAKLMQPIHHKNKLKQFLQRKYYRMMVKHFSEWRSEAYKSQIEYLKTRIKQFGPEIEQISKRQKSTFEQKLVLMNIIDSKEKTIKGFIKQLEQAEYTIKTKQDKYQKLKEYMHDAGEDLTVVGSHVQPGSIFAPDRNRVPQRDFDTFMEEDRKEYFNSFRRF